MEYASKGVGGTGLGFGIAGTALGLLNGGAGSLLNWGGCHDGVSRYDATLVQEVAARDAQIALRDANTYNDQKLLEMYKYFDGKIDHIHHELRDQAVYNGVNTATINGIQNQVQQLLRLTKRVVPNESICPGWGDVTVSITPTTTAADATA